MAEGAVWMVLLRASDRVLSLASMLVLARLLVPADFGVVAIASSVLALLEAVTALGLDVALISKKDVSREHYDSAWTLKVLLGIGIALAALAISGIAGDFFDEPRVANVVAMLAFGSVIQGFENIGVVDFRKELHFVTEFRFQLAKRLIMLAVTVPLAFALRDYWALTIGAVIGRLAWVVLSYMAHPFRPRWSFTRTQDLMNISVWLVFNSVLYYVRDQSASLALGRLAGPRATGLFAMSLDFASLPTSQLIAPINRAVLPGFAKLRGDLEEFTRGVFNVFALTCALAIPAGAGLLVTAPISVPLLLGDQWLDAVPVVQLLALACAITSLLSSSWAAYLALESPRIPALIDCGCVVMQAVLLVLLCPTHGAEGAAIAVLATAIVIVPLNYLLLLPKLQLPVRTLPRILIRPAIAATVMLFALQPFVAIANSTGTLKMAAVLILAVPAGLAVYTLTLLILWILWGRPAGAEALLLEWLESRLPSQCKLLALRLLSRPSTK
jgi:O-antigen/teichoic acid export membrane protein